MPILNTQLGKGHRVRNLNQYVGAPLNGSSGATGKIYTPETPGYQEALKKFFPKEAGDAYDS